MNDPQNGNGTRDAFDRARAALRSSGHYDLRLESDSWPNATITAFVDPDGVPDPVRIGGRMKAVVERILTDAGLNVVGSDDAGDGGILFATIAGTSYDGVADRVLIGDDEIHVTIARDPSKPISGGQIDVPSIVHRVPLQRDDRQLSNMMTRSGDSITIVYPHDAPMLAVMINRSTSHLRIRSR